MNNRFRTNFGKKDLAIHPPGNQLRVLIVDDEPTVHDISILLLRDFEYKGHTLQLVSAYSAADAKEILVNMGPFALILLDVIMETDDAGLLLARFIREELNDPLVRIILRTGQPGVVPQKQVMRDYEIDDYKEKSELTSERFDSAVTASIRTYLSFRRLEQSRQGLLCVLDTSKNLKYGDIEYYIPTLALQQIESVIGRSNHAETGSLLVSNLEHSNAIVGCRGKFAEAKGDIRELLDETAMRLIQKVFETGSTILTDQQILAPLNTEFNVPLVLYLEDCRGFGDLEMYLIEIYVSQITVVLNNKVLNQEMLRTQQELTNTLEEVIESRSQETGQHVQRVGKIAELIVNEVGLNNTWREMLVLVAPLHDIGKVGISDAILKKPGRLNENEIAEMRQHTRIGYDILKKSQRSALQMAARICLEHHEWWNGNGYPCGLTGENITIEARICAIADVIDALCSKRVYKDAISIEEAIDIILAGRGIQFDPSLVDIVQHNRNKIGQIYLLN